jgi:hypothetical protein
MSTAYLRSKRRTKVCYHERFRASLKLTCREEAIHDILEEIQVLVEKEDWDDVKNAAVRLKCLQGIEAAIKDKINPY